MSSQQGREPTYKRKAHNETRATIKISERDVSQLVSAQLMKQAT